MKHHIPSYDDLTPSIPDVSPGEVFGVVERLLPASPPPPRQKTSVALASLAGAKGDGGPVAWANGHAHDRHVRRATIECSFVQRATPSQLFACLRSDRAQAVVDIAREFSPRLQRYGHGCVVADVAGLGGLLGDAEAIGAELARAGRSRGGAIATAVAPTQVAAMLLSLASPFTVATGNVEMTLADVPIAVLQRLLADIHGVPPFHTHVARRTLGTSSSSAWPSWESCERSFEVLQRWGLKTLGELAALPPGDLAARMGQDGVALQRLARGMDPRPFVPDPDVPRFVETMELEWPIDALEALSFVLARMLDPLSSALARADRGAAAIRLDLRLVDRTMHARVLQLPAAMRDPRALRTLLLLDLESHPPTAAIDVVTIEIDPAPGRVIQYSLLERALPSAETLATLTARLGALIGESRCGSPALLNSHRPDAFEMRRFAPEACPPGHRNDRVLPVLRRFRPPVAVRATVERGRPVRVAIDRRGMPGGRVAQCAGPWRTSGAWWDHAAAGWNRDEWEVALSDGSVCRLFRERDSGRWFLEGVLD